MKTQKDHITPSPENWVHQAEQTRRSLKESRFQIDKSVYVSMVIFQMGREQYATPIQLIKEVVKAPPIAPIPQAPHYIAGLANIRGNVMALIDFQKRIQGGTIELQRPYVMVLNEENIRSGILIEGVPETVSINEDHIDRSNAVVKNLSSQDGFIDGLIKHEGKMIILIDVKKLILNT